MSEQPRDGDVLESGRRLSESSTWRLQREFFDRRGAKAWSENRVPSHVTSNAYIAEAYLQLALRFIQDGVTAPPGSPMAIDPTQPVHILELGAGHGYFGYLFLCKLLEVSAQLPFAMPPVRYVLTDFTESNLAAWRAHPRLEPFFKAGMLDLARFDAERDTELVLERSGERLATGNATPQLRRRRALPRRLPHRRRQARGGAGHAPPRATGAARREGRARAGRRAVRVQADRRSGELLPGRPDRQPDPRRVRRAPR